MPTSLSTVLVILTGIVLILLVLFAYLRNRQGDQRMINTTNQMLLPILSAIAITISIIYANHQTIPTCSGALDIIHSIGVLAAILLILVGVVRFFLSRSRDRRLITHPIFFAIILLTIGFQPHRPLVQWRNIFLRCGLPTLAVQVTNDLTAAYAFAGLWQGEVMYTPLTSSTRYRVATEQQ